MDRNIGGPDASFSINETESTSMVKAVWEAEKVVFQVSYKLTERKKKSRDFCRSLYVVKDFKKGEVITEENVRSIRPGYGLHPKQWPQVNGNKAKQNIDRGIRLSLNYLLDE